MNQKPTISNNSTSPSPSERGPGGEVNRVQQSSLVTLNLEDFYTPGDRAFFDLKPFLFQEIILKEKDFREKLKQTDWQVFKGKHVAIGCTAEAIIPTWAHMLVAINLQPVVASLIFGSLRDLEIYLFRKAIEPLDWQAFTGAKVVVKGCSKIEVPEAIYVEVTAKLRPLVFSIMFGEPCSTVPLFKAPRP